MRTWMRRAAVALVGVVALLVLAAGLAYGLSEAKLNSASAPAHALDTTGVDVAEGKRLAGVFGCTGCHGPRLEGTMLIDAMPFARLPAPNLTAGRAGPRPTDERWELAIRHGIGFDGRAMFVMPSPEYSQLSDEHVGQIVAWARSLPPFADTLPAREFGPVGRVLVALGQLPLAPTMIPADVQHLDPVVGPTAEYGHYLTRLCVGCHGSDLRGGPPEQREPAPGPDLSPAGNLGSWTPDQFIAAMRTGRTPDGRMLDPEQMPWGAIGQANDVELSAIWEYLSSLQPPDAPVHGM